MIVIIGDCNYGYTGFSYRTCSEGRFGVINYQFCKQILPKNLKYDRSEYEFVKDRYAYIKSPSYVNIISKFDIYPSNSLPDGLSFQNKYGSLSGYPREEFPRRTFTIKGMNDVGSDSTSISISVRKGICKTDGHFKEIEVDEVYSYDCSQGGSYVGTQTRACNLGEVDGEWGEISGICVHVALIWVIIIVVVLLLIAVVSFCFVFACKKIKGRKNAARSNSSIKNSSFKKNRVNPLSIDSKSKVILPPVQNESAQEKIPSTSDAAAEPVVVINNIESEPIPVNIKAGEEAVDSRMQNEMKPVNLATGTVYTTYFNL